MTVEIKSKIIGLKVKQNDQIDAAKTVESLVVKPDVNPLLVRIDNRPEGTLEAVSEKISYSTSEGRKRVYMLVSFLPIQGVLDGQEVTIERPIEFFFPVGQQGSEHQWITATMRNLSLAARGGYATQALMDLRKVVWDKGPVRCGTNQWGKPIHHDSEVAAIAWSIQQILYKRGFVDVDGNQVPANVLARNYARRHGTVCDLDEDTDLLEDLNELKREDVPEEVASSFKAVGECPVCTAELALLDGCPTCVTGCGYSKCS